jgi:hypothetical protein
MKKIANRSRRLASKLREILLGIQNRESQIQAVQANAELGAEEKESLIARLRSMVSAERIKANRLDSRKRELAYEDIRPNPANREQATRFLSHTDVLTDDRKNPTRWTRLSRRECKCARAFFSLQEAYGAR